MITWYCVRALIYRHMIPSVRDFSRITDLVYWPLFDIVMWGFTGRWLQQSSATGSDLLPYMLLCSLLIWQVTMRAQMELSFSLIEEMWSRNLVNLFSTPVKLADWMVASMLLGVIKITFTLSMGMAAIWLLYTFSVVSLGLPLFLFVPIALLNGWFIGFLTVSAIILGGPRFSSLIWMIGWLFAPISAVFYPVSVLPPMVQTISHYIPMTYLFEGLRSYISTGIVPYSFLAHGTLLSLLYLIGSMCLFVCMFSIAKRRGLKAIEEE